MSMAGTPFSMVNSLPPFSGTENGNVLSVSSALENRFLLHYERSVFNQIMQNVSESVEEFANRIRCQAAKCRFQEQIHDLVMLDRFIAGLIDRNLRNTLLMEKNISFEDAYNMSKILGRNGAPSTTSVAAACHTKDSPKTQFAFGPSVSVPPTCPTEDLVVSPLYPRLPPLRDASFNAVRSPAPKDTRTDFEATPAIGTYVMALKSDLKHTRGNAPIWKMVTDSGLLEKFVPFVEGRVIGYKSSAVFSRMSAMAEEIFEKVEVENETKEIDANGKCITVVLLKPRTEFTVGTYIVLKSDLKSKKRPPIWRVAGASILQKFVPNPRGEVHCYRSNKFFTCTDWTWRLSNEDYCEVTVVKEKAEDAYGYKVSAIRLKEDALQLAKSEMGEKEFVRDKVEGSIEERKNLEEAEFVVGAYVVLKDDVEMSSIWRIRSRFLLQKFTRQADENGDAKYVCDNVDTTSCTDSRWLSSKEEFYKVVAVTSATTEVDPSGRKVMTVRLKEDFFPFRTNHRHRVENEYVNKSDLGGNTERFKIAKTTNKKIKKTRKRKIRNRIFCGLVTLLTCCV